MCVVLAGCGPKITGVEFTDDELTAERPEKAYNRVKPPEVLKVRKQSPVVPVLDTNSCTTYCGHVMRNCRASQAVYASFNDCLVSCRDASWSPGKAGITNSDSLACRLTWAKASAQNTQRCVDASATSPACRQVAVVITDGVPKINRSGLCVMGLYDSTDQPHWNAGDHCRDVILRERIAPVIAELGWVLRLHDVSGGLPTSEAMADCRAIISVFYDGKMSGAANYANWLAQHAKQGRRLVILNNFGAYQESSNGSWVAHDVINTALRMVGVRYDGQWTGDVRLLSAGKLNPAMFTSIPNVKTAKHYYRFRITRDDVDVHFEVIRSDLNEGASAVVMSSPAGGLALTRYYETQEGTELLNLERFLRASLTTEQ